MCDITYNSCSLAQVSLFQKAPKCFSGDSWVKLMDRRRQNISQLRRGEKLLAFDGSNLLYSEMILMLDSNPQVEGKLMIMFKIDFK